MQTVEDAYILIAKTLLHSCSKEEWESLTITAPILGTNLGGTVSVQKLSDGTEKDIPIGFGIFEIQKAVLFLREDMLKNKGIVFEDSLSQYHLKENLNLFTITANQKTMKQPMN